MSAIPKRLGAAANDSNELGVALRELRKALLTVAVFSSLINVLMLSPAIHMLQIYDPVLGSRNETTLVVLSVMVVGAYLFMAALEAVRSRLLVRVGARLDSQLNSRVFTAAFERNLRRPPHDGHRRRRDDMDDCNVTERLPKR